MTFTLLSLILAAAPAFAADAPNAAAAKDPFKTDD